MHAHTQAHSEGHSERTPLFYATLSLLSPKATVLRKSRLSLGPKSEPVGASSLRLGSPCVFPLPRDSQFCVVCVSDHPRF